MAERDHSPKLSDVWGFVLLRGLIEGSLLLLFFFDTFYTEDVGSLALFISIALGAGSVVELIMAQCLRGHAFRGILIFTGLTGLMISGFILYNFYFSTAVVTLTLLVVMMGLWVAARGFAALWLGLSIVAGTFERAVPVGAGFIGLAVGFSALLFFSPDEPTWFVRLLALYGLASLVVHALVALRMRRDRRRVQLEERRAQEREQRVRKGEQSASRQGLEEEKVSG